jgi:hypothetical protein
MVHVALRTRNVWTDLMVSRSFAAEDDSDYSFSIKRAKVGLRNQIDAFVLLSTGANSLQYSKKWLT